MKNELLTSNKEWWESLPKSQQEIIRFCRNNENAIKKGLGIAQARERYLDTYYKSMTGEINTPPKVEKYEFVYAHFENFKQQFN
jgi:TRAP-type C4-dicarboxylate transport system substrate-binding protein